MLPGDQQRQRERRTANRRLIGWATDQQLHRRCVDTFWFKTGDKSSGVLRKLKKRVVRACVRTAAVQAAVNFVMASLNSVPRKGLACDFTSRSSSASKQVPWKRRISASQQHNAITLTISASQQHNAITLTLWQQNKGAVSYDNITWKVEQHLHALYDVMNINRTLTFLTLFPYAP